MESKKKQALLGPVPRGKVVVFRKNTPILIDKSVLAWRLRNKKRRLREKLRLSRIAKYSANADKIISKLGAKIFNPFAPDED